MNISLNIPTNIKRFRHLKNIIKVCSLWYNELVFVLDVVLCFIGSSDDNSNNDDSK